MWIRQLLMLVIGISFGMLAAGGVFTVFIAVGLIPRFAGKTHTAKKVFLYEGMVEAGAIIGCILSVFHDSLPLGRWIREALPNGGIIWNGAGSVILAAFGIFAGMFVGCLALAIAEMLDSIPIFARRVGFRHGLGIAVAAMAAGKLFGSLAYFLLDVDRYIG